jgi:hypothetical protein
MATESFLFHDGAQTTLSTASDARNSTTTGSTLLGPNGSGQFLAMYYSTAARVTNLCTSTFGASTALLFAGLLQNKPGPGDAPDIGMFGFSKAVAGLATITPGTPLQTSSTANGVLTPWVGGNGPAVAVAIEAAATVGAVFTVFLNRPGAGSFST